jgi:hypothetical protein
MGQRGTNGLRPAQIVFGCYCVEGRELCGRKPNRYDLHWLSPTTGTPTTPTLQGIDVVTSLGLLGPLLNLVLTRHADIV